MTAPMPPTDEQLAAWVGPKWESVYRRRFEKFRASTLPGFQASWNWRPALFPVWFLRHRLYAAFAMLLLVLLVVVVVGAGVSGTPIIDSGGALLLFGVAWFLFFPIVLGIALYSVVSTPDTSSIIIATMALMLMIVQGSIGDWLFYRKAVATAGGESVPASGAGTARWVTNLVAVSLVLVFAGGWLFFNAASCACGGGKAYVAAMKSDLRNLVTAEESYFADSVRYTMHPDTVYFRPTTGVSVTIGFADGTSWSATAKHASSDQVCGIWVGTTAPKPFPLSNWTEGEPKCKKP